MILARTIKNNSWFNYYENSFLKNYSFSFLNTIIPIIPISFKIKKRMILIVFNLTHELQGDAIQ